VVIDGSTTVFINSLAACRQGDTVLEPVGPPDPITLGLQTVIIGDQPGSTIRASLCPTKSTEFRNIPECLVLAGLLASLHRHCAGGSLH